MNKLITMLLALFGIYKGESMYDAVIDGNGKPKKPFVIVEKEPPRQPEPPLPPQIPSEYEAAPQVYPLVILVLTVSIFLFVFLAKDGSK